MSLQLHKRTYYSAHHIQAACLFAKQARTIEVERAGTTEFSPEHRASILASIFFSVAFLEASVNELFTDAYDGHLRRLEGLKDEAVELMRDMWSQGIPRTARYSVLEKYAIALSLARRKPMNKGRAPWQPTAVLIQLRNALIHYEPEWIQAEATGTQEQAHKLAKALRGRFAPNPLTGAGNPYYPDKVLGHGCAEWAVSTSKDFVDAFADRLGIKRLPRP
jgi:hypothetical protein